MAYTDFEIFDVSSFGGGNLSGVSGSGLPILNSSLANPLSGSYVSNYCRYNKQDGGGTVEGSKLFAVKNTVYSGSLVNIPSTKGMQMIFSARGTLNYEYNSSFQNGSSVGVFVKNVNLGKANNRGLFGSGCGGEGHFGYGLRLGNLTNYAISPSSIHIGLWARNNNLEQQQIVTSLPGVLGTVAYDKWYTLKLLVIPSGNIQDTLRAFILTGTDIDNPNDFTEIASIAIPSTSQLYVPWSSTTSRNGFYYSRGSPTNFGSVDQAGYAWYIDRFSAKLKNII